MGEKRWNDQKGKTVDSQYIQQHLANERTFLAWLRTSITMIGVGFLVINLHLSAEPSNHMVGELMLNIIGLFSVGVGIFAVVTATISYMEKIHAINEQSFLPPKKSILLIAGFVVLIAITFSTYFLFL